MTKKALKLLAILTLTYLLFGLIFPQLFEFNLIFHLREKGFFNLFLANGGGGKLFDFYNDFSIFLFLGLIFIFLVCQFKLSFKLWALVLFASIIFSVPMIKSGIIEGWGMGFWGPNGHDGVWHLSLMDKWQSMPPINPVFSGTRLFGYHWGFDLLAGMTASIFNWPIFDVYFRFFPILIGLLIGLLSLKLAKKITDSYQVGVLFLLLNFFCGSFGWLFTLIKDGSIGGESLFWSMQSISTLINPPFALSLVGLLFGLICWLDLKKQDRWTKAVVIGFVFGILGLIKIYAGLLSVAALLGFYLIKRFVLKDKDSKQDLLVFLSAGATLFLSLVVMGVEKSPGSLVFSPFWFTHSLIESIDKLYWPRLATLRINLANTWLSYKLPVLIGIEAFLIVLFLIGNLGVRIFGLFTLGKKMILRQLNKFDLFALPLLVFAFLTPMFFVQKGTAWNTIQFFYYFLFIANFYLAVFLFDLFSYKKKLVSLFAVGIMILALPTTISTLKGYFGSPPPAAIPRHELEALAFLKSLDSGIVLAFPYDKFAKKPATPIPLYLYETTAYVSAFSKKTSFLADEMNLSITGFDYQDRKLDSEKFFITNDKFWARGFLINNKIGYIYLVDNQQFRLQEVDLGLKMIFNNGQVKIYKVLR